MPGADEDRARPLWLRLLLVCIGAACSAPFDALADARAGAVVLLYHHVSERTPPSTSITPEKFERHLEYLAEQGYAVLPLTDIVAALQGGGALPAKAVALTFDDAYRSIYTDALPRLERRGWPFTVFVSTDAIDAGYSNFMTWDELREVEARGATIANHSRDHAHLIRHEPGESDAAWRRRVSRNIMDAQARLEAGLDRPSRLFAYPYGEFDSALEDVVANLEFVAFGQQSGPLGAGSGLRHLPRYPMATGYDDLEDLAEKLRTRPLPVTVIGPASRVLAPRADAPSLRIRLGDGPYRRAGLRCYVAGQEPARIEWDGDLATIRARAPLGPGRSKYNCTAPSSTENGVFYWYSYLWIQPRDDGSWYPN